MTHSKSPHLSKIYTSHLLAAVCPVDQTVFIELVSLFFVLYAGISHLK